MTEAQIVIATVGVTSGVFGVIWRMYARQDQRHAAALNTLLEKIHDVDVRTARMEGASEWRRAQQSEERRHVGLEVADGLRPPAATPQRRAAEVRNG